MKETRRRKEVRRWQIKKIALYIVSLAILVIGAIVTVQGVDPLEQQWKFITGFAILLAGVFLFLETYGWSFKDYLSKKRKKAR